MHKKPLIENMTTNIWKLDDGGAEMRVQLVITVGSKTKTMDPIALRALEPRLKKEAAHFAMADVIEAVAELKQTLREVGNQEAGNPTADYPAIQTALAKVDRTLDGEQ